MSRDPKEVQAAVRAALVAAGVTRALAPPVVDSRPRFRNGQLKDLRAHLEETLDFEMIELAGQGDPRGSRYVAEHKADIETWTSRFGAQQQAEAAEAAERAELEGVAQRLGVTVEALLDGDRVEEMQQRAVNAQLEDEAREILARKQPIPEPAAE
jgi:hypothetical protein